MLPTATIHKMQSRQIRRRKKSTITLRQCCKTDWPHHHWMQQYIRCNAREPSKATHNADCWADIHICSICTLGSVPTTANEPYWAIPHQNAAWKNITTFQIQRHQSLWFLYRNENHRMLPPDRQMTMQSVTGLILCLILSANVCFGPYCKIEKYCKDKYKYAHVQLKSCFKSENFVAWCWKYLL